MIVFAVMGHKFTLFLTKEIIDASNIMDQKYSSEPTVSIEFILFFLKCYWKNGF